MPEKKSEEQTPKDRITFYINGKQYAVKIKKGETAVQHAVRAELKKKEIEDGIFKINKNILVEKWADEWLETYKRPSIDSSTYGDYLTRFKKHINPIIGKMRLCDVKPLHCQKVLNKMQGYSKDRIDKVNRTMKALFEQAVDDELIRSNPAKKLQKPVAEDGTHRAITDKERKVILQVAETHRGGIFFKIMLYCGLRPAEVAALLWTHIDLKKNKLHVVQAIKKNGTIGEPKSKAGIRKIPIPKLLSEELKTIKADPFSYVVLNTKGVRLSNRNIRTLWENFEREMNIAMGCKIYRNQVMPPYRVAEDLVPYCLRHTYCTDLQAAGVPINIARELMGHEDIRTTLKIYTHHSETAFDNARESIDSYHAGSKKTDDNEDSEKVESK